MSIIHQYLPSSLVEKVLLCLDSKPAKQAASLVSRHWHEIQITLRRSLRLRLVSSAAAEDGEKHYSTETLIESRAEQALKIWPNLSSLTIEQEAVFDPKQPDVKPSDVSFLGHEMFTNACKKLTTLQLISCAGVDDDLLACLGAGGRLALKQLSLRRSDGVSDQGMLALASSCPDLITLEIAPANCITDKGLDALLSRCCPRLQRLEKIQGWGVRHGRELTHLNLMGCGVTTEGLWQGLRGSTSLRSLNLRWQQAINGPLRFGVIGRFCPLLEELYLRDGLERLKDEDVLAITRGSPSLKVLDVSRCHDVKARGWRGLARHARQLQELDAVECEGLKDRGMEALRLGCPMLRLLRLVHRDPDLITDLDLTLELQVSQQTLQRFCGTRHQVTIRRDEYGDDIFSDGEEAFLNAAELDNPI
ncbi:hypothetical protein L7F22_034652 [Adiantum nelumboides]|nr:hypothetical protein [Adiantum nelumboides]